MLSCYARAIACYLLVLVVSLFSHYCSDTDTPEHVASAYLKRIEKAIAERDVRTIRSAISNSYQDDQGRTRQDIETIAAGYVLRNRSIHLLTRLTAYSGDGQRVAATVLAAFAARPITDLSVLPHLNADIYWFDIELAKSDDEWQLIKSAWRQAMVNDFFPDQ